MTPETVTAQRIKDVLAELGYSTESHDDDTLIGVWDGQEVSLSVTRDWIQIQTAWDPSRWSDLYHAQSPDGQLELVTAACEQWNASHIQPRAYPVEENANWFINLDVVVGCRRGMTAEQLESFLTFALTATVVGAQDIHGFLPPLL